MVEDWTFDVDGMNQMTTSTLIQEELTYAELDEYSYPTVFGVEDTYGDTCEGGGIICFDCK